MASRDYGADIACPHCGSKVHITPRQLQTELEIIFTCPACGADVVHENDVAREIAIQMETIGRRVARLKI